jgi:hypothetical protein
MLFMASAHAQVKEVSVPIAPSIAWSAGATESTDTLLPPFVDDFSQAATAPNPALWTDANVWINDALPLYQNSVGVATFDGCNGFGKPYVPGSTNSDTLADILTSKYLNLQGMTNVWLSFQYQRAGLGEAPSTTDSLVVQFYSPITGQWSHAWGAKGTGSADAFQTAMIPVQGVNYLQKGFRFRMATYGARGGAYDVWNVDYVQLDKDRNAADSIITEPAFARPHPLIIGTKNYTSWPWWLDMSNSLANRPSNLTFTYRRMGTVPSGGWSLNLGQFRWFENGSLVQQLTAVPVITNTQHDQDQTFDVAVPSSAIGLLSGPTVVETEVWFDGSAAGLRSNDTVRGRLELDNYLSLDDGTAERAYGIENVIGSRVAQKFITGGLGNSDSLKGVAFNFVTFDDDNNAFKIAVWAPADSGDAPGQLIYMSDSTYEGVRGWNIGDLMPYALDSAVDISAYTSVWIGYVDMSSQSTVYVGLDRHRDLPISMPRYYGDGFNWYPSLETGTLIMRPFFRYNPSDMHVSAPEQDVAFSVYPNPASTSLSIQTNSIGTIGTRILSLDGQVMLEQMMEPNTPLDISSFAAGVYVVEITHGDQVWRTKWMKY